MMRRILIQDLDDPIITEGGEEIHSENWRHTVLSFDCSGHP